MPLVRPGTVNAAPFAPPTPLLSIAVQPEGKSSDPLLRRYSWRLTPESAAGASQVSVTSASPGTASRVVGRVGSRLRYSVRVPSNSQSKLGTSQVNIGDNGSLAASTRSPLLQEYSTSLSECSVVSAWSNPTVKPKKESPFMFSMV